MQINITYGSGVTSQSAAFQAQFAAAANAAVQYFEHTITNNVTVTISLDYAALGPGAVASNGFSLQGFYSYATVRQALASHSTSGDDATALANLPLVDPGNATNGYVLTNAQARALGLSTVTGSPDDAITLNSSLNFSFDPNNRNAAGTYDAIGAIQHEVSEGVLGRFQNLNADGNRSNAVLDLFRFTAAGTNTRTYGTSADGWFSIDGVHNLERYNNLSVQNSDLADWYPTIRGDSFGNGSTGTAGLVTATDLRVLDVIGWNRAPATVNDFNGDGVSDILFTSAATNDLGYYRMNASNQGWAPINRASAGYSVVGTGDFNSDFASDILYRNNVTGDLGFYAMSNGGAGTGSGNTPGNDRSGSLAGWVPVGGSSTSYSVVGVGNFVGSSAPEILFRNNATGDLGYYYSNGASYNNWQGIGGSSTSYNVAGLGDFYGTGTSDVLFRNASTGDFGFYKIVNGVNAGWVGLGGSSTSYAIVGIGDFYGVGSGRGGTSDILFRNATTGDMGFYDINNGTLGAWHSLGGSSTAYSVVAIGDYYGNGTDDILMRNNTNGDLGYFAMSNGVISGWHSIGGSSAAYSVVGDLTSNGISGAGKTVTGDMFQTLGGAPEQAPMSQTLGGSSTSLATAHTLFGEWLIAPLSRTDGGIFG